MNQLLRPDPLANVSNLGHTGDVKPIIFHPTALEFIRGEDPTIRREIGEALRDLQKGFPLGMPLSRPMPDVASGAHELRVMGKHPPCGCSTSSSWLMRFWCFTRFRRRRKRPPNGKWSLANND